jgi:hypothetical protein
LDNYSEENNVSSEMRPYLLNHLSATGRGKAEPIRDKEGIEDPEKSRRVVFKIRVRSFEEKIAEVTSAANPIGATQR